MEFETSYQSILQKIDQLDPHQYAATRNYVDGAVSYLSPYISRGVISTKQVLDSLLAKGYKIFEMESLVKELCWRDYFQRVAQVKDLNTDIKQAQTKLATHQIPSAIVEANTGIEGIDIAIQKLYETGYVHNHCRMYTASLACNLAQAHWLHPAQWMYYHLLDGDWASNACSWQWVAAANSNKKYYANQENINRFTHTQQSDTYLDTSYEELAVMDIPEVLLTTETLKLSTHLPEATPLVFDPNLPTFIYNYYNLDPLWHQGDPGNRILLLEPEFFERYPVSEKCIDFILNLSKNIANLQVYVGSFASLATNFQEDSIYYKEHPFNVAYSGIQESRAWIAPDVVGFYPSFFAYWKVVQKHLS